jgi:hypothetical protein
MLLMVFSKENRLPNEFFLYVLEDLHTSQSLAALKLTSTDAEFVKVTVESVYPATNPSLEKSPGLLNSPSPRMCTSISLHDAVRRPRRRR